MKKQWRLLSPAPPVVERLARKLRIGSVAATLLANRGLTDPEDAKTFIDPSLSSLTPPWHLADMDQAVSRIHRALQRREMIMVFGDYDVDGVTASVLVADFLIAAGGRVMRYIPHRIEEGYGLKVVHIREHAVPAGVGLIVTVDCGSGSHEAVQAAQAAGIDVIVTDHHETGGARPEAVAVVNPKRKDCRAGLDALAGVGVAFFLVIALRRHLRDKAFWEERREPNLKAYCDLVALGTVADLVPLTGDNRVLVKTGIAQLNRRSRPGLAALIKSVSKDAPILTEMDIAFRLSPRINAAGRIRHADRAVALLTANADDAPAAAQTLVRLNTERRETEREIFDEIVHYLKRYPPHQRHDALVLASPAWHEGVLGIVASRLAEKLHCPVVLIAIRNGIGKGSGRSIPGVHLHECLQSCSDLLIDFGGHAMAAGVRIDTKRINAFSEAFARCVTDNRKGQPPGPQLEIDTVIDFSMITPQLMDDIDLLRPFGTGNPEPLFQAEGISVVHAMVVGGRHCKMQLAQKRTGDRDRLPAIWFNAAPETANQRFFDKIAFRLQWNHWKGHPSIQLIIEAAE
jgi:single-stranded-DNA-specific exonuclease